MTGAQPKERELLLADLRAEAVADKGNRAPRDDEDEYEQHSVHFYASNQHNDS